MPHSVESGLVTHTTASRPETWLQVPHLLPPDDFGDCNYHHDLQARFESWKYGQAPRCVEVALAYPFGESKTAYLPRIDIGETLRGRGIGRKVVDNICVYLTTRGFEYLVVVAEPLRRGEPDPRGFYEKVGFQPLDPWQYCQIMPEPISSDPRLELYLPLSSARPS